MAGGKWSPKSGDGRPPDGETDHTTHHHHHHAAAGRSSELIAARQWWNRPAVKP